MKKLQDTEYTGVLPATLQTVAGYLAGYKIWGNTEQTGTPTPENPIMPSGCGVRTENFWNFQPSTEYSGVTLTWNGAKIVFSGICTSSSNLKKSITLSAGTYTIKANANRIPLEDYNSCVDVYKESPYMLAKIPNRNAINGIANFTLGNETTVSLRIRIEAGVNYDGFTLEPMLNAGSTALPYEPYGYKLPILSNDTATDIYIGDTALAKDEYVDSSEGKIYKWADITGLSEPLCGIGEYTDSLDLSTGTLTKRIKKLVLTGGTDEIYVYESSFTRFYVVIADMLGIGVRLTPLYCTHYRNVSDGRPIGDVPNNSIYTGGGSTINNTYIKTTDYTSVTDFKSYLAAQYAAGTPVTIWYVLAEPEISTVPVPSGLTGTIEGYLRQDGTPTPENPIYPTANGIKQKDGTYTIKSAYITPTDPPATLPQIPTAAGETTIDYGATALPHAAGLDGVFEYGNIDGLTWKNSVSGENDITFDTAVTDTGAEYVLPAGASGQYTSKSGEYRTAFTWYCIAKCPTTCHSAGQYMVSNWNNQGVEISSGWAAYSSAGVNHLVRSINNNDFNSAGAVTSYALIVVSGDVNGVASVYVNGVKKTDSWNFNPVSSDRAAAVYLGKRASGQLSGTDIDYKFLAFGTTKQTDSEIATNSQYLMTKYLGVGRPEKVELDVHGWTNMLYSIYHQGKWINSAEKKRINGKWV